MIKTHDISHFVFDNEAIMKSFFKGFEKNALSDKLNMKSVDETRPEKMSAFYDFYKHYWTISLQAKTMFRNQEGVIFLLWDGT